MEVYQRMTDQGVKTITSIDFKPFMDTLVNTFPKTTEFSMYKRAPLSNKRIGNLQDYGNAITELVRETLNDINSLRKKGYIVEDPYGG